MSGTEKKMIRIFATVLVVFICAGASVRAGEAVRLGEKRETGPALRVAAPCRIGAECVRGWRLVSAVKTATHYAYVLKDMKTGTTVEVRLERHEAGRGAFARTQFFDVMVATGGAGADSGAGWGCGESVRGGGAGE